MLTLTLTLWTLTSQVELSVLTGPRVWYMIEWKGLRLKRKNKYEGYRTYDLSYSYLNIRTRRETKDTIYVTGGRFDLRLERL